MSADLAQGALGAANEVLDDIFDLVQRLDVLPSSSADVAVLNVDLRSRRRWAKPVVRSPRCAWHRHQAPSLIQQGNKLVEATHPLQPASDCPRLDQRKGPSPPTPPQAVHLTSLPGRHGEDELARLQIAGGQAV